MNKKKYIGVGIFAAVIVVGAGVAYYCYPAEINSMIGIGVPQAGVIADGVSSSALALDDGADIGSGATSSVASSSDVDAAPAGDTVQESDVDMATTTDASSSSASSSPTNASDTDVIFTDTTSTASTTGSSSQTSSSSASSPNHILIAAVQTGGASSSNDLVKLYNPTAAAIDVSGWKLHKKSETGTDYSLKEFPAGSTIAAGQFFVWANSIGGFSETVDANVSSTETLAADNSVAIMDSAGDIVDAVAWGTGTSQYGEGPPYPTSPGANQLLSRRSSDGAMADTGDNSDDFTIQ